MILIADSSALIALSVADSLHLLDQLFGAVWVPQAVFDECTYEGKPQSLELKHYLEDKVKVVDTSNQIWMDVSSDLGETEAMILYKQMHADRLLIDDKNARRIAHLNGITTIGSIGVLLAAKQAGLVDSVRPLLDKIMRPPLFFSLELYKQALMLADE
jgi:uncharacterized protein